MNVISTFHDITLVFVRCIMLVAVAAASTVAAADEYQPDRQVNYKTVDQVELKLHIFEPPTHHASDQAPAVVFFFGGGWNGGSPKQFYEQARFLADRGVVAMSAEYRVKGVHKTSPFECVTDGKSAIRWVRTHAKELGVNPDKIVASGGSAGGHVAACTGLIEGLDEAGEDLSVSSIPNAMILFNPVLDTTAKGYGMEKVGKNRQTEISPCHHVRAGIAPTLLFHGTADTTVPFENAERFDRLMKEAGNTCQLVSFPDQGHGFFNGIFFRPKTKDTSHYTRTMKESVNFLTSLGYLNSGKLDDGDPSSTKETLPALAAGKAPATFAEMWAEFDPRAEPLEVETITEWEEDGVVLRIVRFRIGVFRGKKATLAAVYGFPKSVIEIGKKLPGLLQIHGGGQYADYKACLTNAKRGYATISIAWAGRISAPEYRVDPKVVKLFWDGKSDDPNYKLTTDWGAVDGYHAPGRNPTNQFPSVKPADFTLDTVESPRNSGWFLCALAARRSLTFLEQQPEVDPERLGVYGHSMGGKLTVMTATDPRVKAAAPSCGGISDRDNESQVFRSTLGDDVSLKQISCPIIFLSPSNDFHGRIGDLPNAVNEISSKEWRVTCSPHRSHQDSAEYEVATQLWFDQHLKKRFSFPHTPKSTLNLKTEDGVPSFSVEPDPAKRILSVDVFYTQHGKPIETRFDRENTVNRFWRHAISTKSNGIWTAKLPIASNEKPLWAYANVVYELDEPVTGAGYYYAIYTANTFNLSSLLKKVDADELKSAGCKTTIRRSLLIEGFERGWEKEWFTNKPDDWGRATHKIYDETWKAPANAKLAVQVRAAEPNVLVVMVDKHVAEVEVTEGDQWQDIFLSPSDFKNLDDVELDSWEDIKELKLSAAERLAPQRGDTRKPRIVGKNWKGTQPEFRNLRWESSDE